MSLACLAAKPVPGYNGGLNKAAGAEEPVLPKPNLALRLVFEDLHRCIMLAAAAQRSISCTGKSAEQMPGGAEAPGF